MSFETNIELRPNAERCKNGETVLSVFERKILWQIFGVVLENGLWISSPKNELYCRRNTM